MGIVTARDQARELRALADQFGVGLEMENTHKGHIRAIFGTCLCNDPNATVMIEWGYRWNGKQWEGAEDEQ